MPERPTWLKGLGDVWQRALDANVRYYEAWGRVATDYVRELSTALKGFSRRSATAHDHAAEHHASL